jgi:hypothetical protein
MKYKISPLLLILTILFLFSSQKARAQGPDSVYIVPTTPFITQLLSFKQLNANIILSEATKQIPVHDGVIDGNGQHLLKQGDDIYIFIMQTGFLYKLVSLDTANCVYKRLDKTVNINYNINCKNFIYKDNIYSYGGYGFWKNNGTLRKFNKQDHEWDVLPLNKEVISTTYLWVSPKDGRMYLPFEKIVNGGLSGPENLKGVPNYTSYYLDVEKQKWVKLGELEKDVIEIVKNDIASEEFIAYSNGFLHLTNEETYLFDILHNKIYKSKNANLNQFLIRRSSAENMFILEDKIYSYNTTTQNFIFIPYSLKDFELLRTSIWGSTNLLYNALFIILGLVLIVVFAYWIFTRVVNRKLELEQLKILKSKTVNQAFTGTELALLNLLVSATQKQDPVEITQINHVLGIKDKNIGLQKKVRSDVMKAINEKYEFITQADRPVIGSSRKEEDKRFYEYFITPSELNTIKRIIEKN